MESADGPDAEDVTGRKAATDVRIFGNGAQIRGSRVASEISAGRRARDFSPGSSPKTRHRFVRESVRRRVVFMTDPLAEGLNELKDRKSTRLNSSHLGIS